jgi:TrmH family RNA methyltransferase
LPEGSADAYAPKVVRAAIGAHFRLPLVTGAWSEIEARLKHDNLKVYLAEAGTGTIYTQAEFRPPVAIIIGGEAEGAGEAAARLAHERVHIPMPGGMESLNAAVAAGIVLFEVVRQRSL